MEKIERAKKETDEAMQVAKVACLMAVAVGDAKARAENDMSRALDALEIGEQDWCRLEAEVAHLAIEQMLLEASKDEVSSFHSQASKDKEAMEEDYQKVLELIFSYAYGCYAFKHSIYGDQPGIPDGMLDSAYPLPPEFFVNPRPSRPQ